MGHELIATPLFQLVDEFREAAERLGDLDLDEQTIADTLEGLSFPVEQKCTQVGAFVRNLEATALAIKAAEAAMAARRKAIEARGGRVRAYLHEQMIRSGISKVDSPWFTVSIKKNPPSVEITEEGKIPCEFHRIIPETWQPDKTAIKDAIKAGKEVPGARLNQTTRVEIK